MTARFLCRHFLGLPRTARNVARARVCIEAACHCLFSFLVGLVCFLLVWPVVSMVFSL